MTKSDMLEKQILSSTEHNVLQSQKCLVFQKIRCNARNLDAATWPVLLLSVQFCGSWSVKHAP